MTCPRSAATLPPDTRPERAASLWQARTMTSDRSLRTDRMWHRIESLCPGTIGGPAAANRRFVEAVLWPRT